MTPILPDETAADRDYLHMLLEASASVPQGLFDTFSGQPLHFLDADDGLVTLTLRESQLNDLQVQAIMAFRLVQYLQLGWISAHLARERRLVHEPTATGGVDNIHVVTLAKETGHIVGYVGLAGAADREPLSLDDPLRTRFPTEIAHRIDLLRPWASMGWTTHDVFEVKRFLRDQSLLRTPLAALIPWHVVLGFGRSLLAVGGTERRVIVIGDAKESAAMRHLVAMGLDLEVVEGTNPSLPRDELMWPIYEQAVVAKPFVGLLPATYAGGMDLIEDFLREARGEASTRGLIVALTRRNQERKKECPHSGATARSHDTAPTSSTRS